MSKQDPLKGLDTEAAKPAAKPAPDKAPKARTRTRTRNTGPSFKVLEDQLNATIGMIGVSVIATGDEYCGGVILAGAPDLSKSVIELAKQNPNIKKALVALNQTSTWGGVVVAAAAIAVPIMGHHGILPANAAAIMGQPPVEPEMETGGAHNPDRANGPRQDDAGPGATPKTDV